MGRLERLVAAASRHLDASERVEQAVVGAYETKRMGTDSVRSGVLLATSHRLVFFAKKLGGYELESFPYGKISSFEANKSLMGTSIQFMASNNTIRLKWIRGNNFEAFTQHVRGHMNGSRNGPETVKMESMGSLAQLAQLRDQGVLSSAEFEAKKKELLERI